jgi:hypothetical protein
LQLPYCGLVVGSRSGQTSAAAKLVSVSLAVPFSVCYRSRHTAFFAGHYEASPVRQAQNRLPLKVASNFLLAGAPAPWLARFGCSCHKAAMVVAGNRKQRRTNMTDTKHDEATSSKLPSHIAY